MKFRIIFFFGLVVSSFQVHATVMNGGFEQGSNYWGGLTETFGFAEVSSSYTDGKGIEFNPTEGSFFYNFWGNEDLHQGLSWKKGDQLSYDWAVAVGTNPNVSGASLFVSPTSGPGLEENLLGPGNTTFDSVTGFYSTTHIFTDDSSEHPGLVFQAQGDSPMFGLTDPEVGHILLDNVSITSVPLPGSVLLMITSLLFGYSGRLISQKRERTKVF
jgi:hypothetical protein